MTPTRLVTAYLIAGPIGTVALSLGHGSNFSESVSTVLGQLFIGLILITILRPWSYRQSMWRAAGGAVWLFIPTALAASVLLPAGFGIVESGPATWAPDPLESWKLAWLALGFSGCAIGAIASARPSLHVTPLGVARHPSDPPQSIWTRRPNWPMLRYLTLVSGMLVLILISAALCFALNLITAIPRSYIQANVPPSREFDRIMKRDLDAYFAGVTGGSGVASYELLRRQPTQVGVAYPKYYAWVRFVSSGGQAREGAARLAAFDQQRFEVFEFIPADEIRVHPDTLAKVFPSALVTDILSHARRTKS
jgi:hypothetical protein